MTLDDMIFNRKIDEGGMIHHIETLPDQLSAAWELGNQLPLPSWRNVRKILISGMGGSAIGGDLVTGYVSPVCSVPIVVNRDYDLPGWAFGEDTLVIASSHSGNTEETLSIYKQAFDRGCKILTISTGGALSKLAKENNNPAWIFVHDGMPRAAVGFSFGLLLAVLTRLGFVAEQDNHITNAVSMMKEQQAFNQPNVDSVNNPSKQLASRLFGKMVSVFGSGYVAPVSRRWKGQINELAKAWAQFDVLPEADHNTLAGTKEPSEILGNIKAVFLQSGSDHVRNQKRMKLTAEIFMKDGIECESVFASGDDPLTHIWTLLHMGDYVSYYMSILYQIDPTPIVALLDFKKSMAE